MALPRRDLRHPRYNSRCRAAVVVGACCILGFRDGAPDSTGASSSGCSHGRLAGAAFVGSPLERRQLVTVQRSAIDKAGSTSALPADNGFAASVASLAAFGGIVGPLADGVHNQALLQYDFAPLSLPLPGFLVQTSWLVPLLLAFAYPVLGVAVPWLLSILLPREAERGNPGLKFSAGITACLAVLSTVSILKVSEVLERSDALGPLGKLAILSGLAVAQWLTLDASLVSFSTALLAAVGGPLAEIPFMLSGCWHYLPSAVDYNPLASFDFPFSSDRAGLSALTGPCYFAVTTDSIAWWRFFQELYKDQSSADTRLRGD
mmetsp:Transcript_28320/g.65654  ORF Transcript_28320/g.65654 Transcript_28320/m.65654 type:complete len:319 (+) Transcript_28320:45-1001(+)